MEATDYFGSDKVPSPVLHYWSLGVEEQFYLVWPAVLILASRGRRPVAAVTVTLVVLVVASFASSVWVTDAAPARAFYSLPTRAWATFAALLSAEIERRLVAAGLLPKRAPDATAAP